MNKSDYFETEKNIFELLKKSLGTRLLFYCLTGSLARGKPVPGWSDIDILLVVDVYSPDFFALLESVAMMGEIMLLMVIGSLIFAVVVFNRSDNMDGEYLITTHGVLLEEKIYYWYQLDKFFFTDQDGGGKTLVLDTYMTFPKRLFLPLSPVLNVANLQEYLSQHIMFIKEAPSDALDRTYKSVMNKFDL